MKKYTSRKTKNEVLPQKAGSFKQDRAFHVKPDTGNRPGTGISSISQSQPGPVIQRYSIFSPDQQIKNKSLGWKSPSMKAIRVGDFGLIAAEEGAKGSNNRVWAIDRKIRASENVLKGLGSTVKLESGTHTQYGKAPYRRGRGRKIPLHEVLVKDRSGVQTGRMKIAEDCGYLSRDVLGLTRPSQKAVAVTGRGQWKQFSKGLGYSSATGTKWAKEALSREFGNNPPKTKNDQRYKRFARKYGVDQYAKPTVGQGLVIAEQNQLPTATSAQNFHMAAVIARSQNDYITMETIVAKNPVGLPVKDNWYFRMYGTVKKGQTFHEETGKSGIVGTNYTTMVFQPEKKIIGVIRSNNAPLYVAGKITAWLNKGTAIRTNRLDRKKRHIRVMSGIHSSKTGWIANWFFKSN